MICPHRLLPSPREHGAPRCASQADLTASHRLAREELDAQMPAAPPRVGTRRIGQRPRPSTQPRRQLRAAAVI